MHDLDQKWTVSSHDNWQPLCIVLRFHWISYEEYLIFKIHKSTRRQPASVLWNFLKFWCSQGTLYVTPNYCSFTSSNFGWSGLILTFWCDLSPIHEPSHKVGKIYWKFVGNFNHFGNILQGWTKSDLSDFHFQNIEYERIFHQKNVFFEQN